MSARRPTSPCGCRSSAPRRRRPSGRRAASSRTRTAGRAASSPSASRTKIRRPLLRTMPMGSRRTVSSRLNTLLPIASCEPKTPSIHAVTVSVSSSGSGAVPPRRRCPVGRSWTSSLARSTTCSSAPRKNECRAPSRISSLRQGARTAARGPLGAGRGWGTGPVGRTASTPGSRSARPATGRPHRGAGHPRRHRRVDVARRPTASTTTPGPQVPDAARMVRLDRRRRTRSPRMRRAGDGSAGAWRTGMRDLVLEAPAGQPGMAERRWLAGRPRGRPVELEPVGEVAGRAACAARGRPMGGRRPARGSAVSTRRTPATDPGGRCGRCTGSCTARSSGHATRGRARGPGRAPDRGSVAARSDR